MDEHNELPESTLNSPIVTDQEPTGGLELFVSTWHVAPLHGGQSEGLPTDLLSRHSALFYLVDHVVCDASGLAGELKWYDHGWLSARVFSWLKEYGLLKVVNLNESPYLPQDFWVDLAQSDAGRAVQQRMQTLTDTIKGGDAEARKRAVKAVDPMVLELNQAIFMNLNTPDHWLPYYQTESHLQVKRSQRMTFSDMPHLSKSSARIKARRRARLLDVVEKCLPDPMLLPPIAGDVKGANTRNMHDESEHLYRVIYGDLSHGNFEDLRRSKAFAKRDEKVDGPEREAIAWQNFCHLLYVRDQTRDLRAHLQALVIQIADRQIPLTEACRRMTKQVEEFQNFLNHRAPVKQIALKSVAMAIAEAVIVAFLADKTPDGPSLGPIDVGDLIYALPIVVPVLMGLAEERLIEPALDRMKEADVREKLPLAAFQKDLEILIPCKLKLFSPN